MTEADQSSTDELKRLTIFEDGLGSHTDAAGLFEEIKNHEDAGKAVVISMPGDLDVPNYNIPDFDYSYNVVMSNDREAMLQRHSQSSDSGPDFLHVRLTDDGEYLEMFHRDMKYGGTFIGNVCSIRPLRR